MAEKIIAQTWAKPKNPARQLTIHGDEKFQINSQSFTISPLTLPAKLYVYSIYDGVENVQELATLNPNDYTQINGLVRQTTLFVDTTEDFYIRF